MRGILAGDTEAEFVVDGSGRTISLARGASDASLAPYHVDRSKLFAFERRRDSSVVEAERVARAIEFTRFPCSLDQGDTNDDLELGLVQAEDLIGELGDPRYSPKANALYGEIEE